jgi:hypothetical protein
LWRNSGRLLSARVLKAEILRPAQDERRTANEYLFPFGLIRGRQARGLAARVGGHSHLAVAEALPSSRQEFGAGERRVEQVAD